MESNEKPQIHEHIFDNLMYFQSHSKEMMEYCLILLAISYLAIPVSIQLFIRWWEFL